MKKPNKSKWIRKYYRQQRKDAANKALNAFFSILLRDVERIKNYEEKRGKWNWIKQLRYDGLKTISEHTKDLSLKEIVNLTYPWNMSYTMTLNKRN